MEAEAGTSLTALTQGCYRIQHGKTKTEDRWSGNISSSLAQYRCPREA